MQNVSDLFFLFSIFIVAVFLLLHACFPTELYIFIYIFMTHLFL